MPLDTVDKAHWVSPEIRVNYYLNNQQTFELKLNELRQLKQRDYWTRKEVNYLSFNDLKGSAKHIYSKYLMPLPLIRELRALPFYKDYRDLHSLIDFLLPFNHLPNDIADVKFPLYYGEHGDTDALPIIRKARKLTDQHSVLYDFRSLRYNTPCLEVNKHDIPWSNKKKDVVWRGATTGQIKREAFVTNYHDRYNVGFSTAKQKPHLAEMIKPRISIAEQLKSQFIVSLQGNDLASNIRWVLFSNSVPIMPKPEWTSWTMEEKLEPFVHYLELDDNLTNLEELLNWADNHPRECEQIAQNGKSYVSQFLDKRHDTQVRMMLLEEFAKRVDVIE